MSRIETDLTSGQRPPSGAGAAYPEKIAPVNYPISELIARRWSSRAFDERRPVEREKVLAMLEAARWAPSSYNEQPWHYLVFDDQDPEARARARACLISFNVWATKAPVLLLSVARHVFAHSGQLNRHAQHDVGLASANLVLEGVHQGLMVHQMAGFDETRARREFAIPNGHTPMAMIAVGYPFTGTPDELPAALRSLELQRRERKPLKEIAYLGKWNSPYGER